MPEKDPYEVAEVIETVSDKLIENDPHAAILLLAREYEVDLFMLAEDDHASA